MSEQQKERAREAQFLVLDAGLDGEEVVVVVVKVVQL